MALFLEALDTRQRSPSIARRYSLECRQVKPAFVIKFTVWPPYAFTESADYWLARREFDTEVDRYGWVSFREWEEFPEKITRRIS